jgi:multidrug transporter EmrE-like cation transporter
MNSNFESRLEKESENKDKFDDDNDAQKMKLFRIPEIKKKSEHNDINRENSINKTSIERTKKRAILVMILCTLFTTIGQILSKHGVNIIEPNNIYTFFNTFIFAGLGIYAFSSLLVIYSFKHGELSILYPILATGYVWVSIMSVYFFNEIMTPLKWAGIFMIILGVSLLGFGSIKHNKINEGLNKND